MVTVDEGPVRLSHCTQQGCLDGWFSEAGSVPRKGDSRHHQPVAGEGYGGHDTLRSTYRHVSGRSR